MTLTWCRHCSDVSLREPLVSTGCLDEKRDVCACVCARARVGSLQFYRSRWWAQAKVSRTLLITFLLITKTGSDNLISVFFAQVLKLTGNSWKTQHCGASWAAGHFVHGESWAVGNIWQLNIGKKWLLAKSQLLLISSNELWVGQCILMWEDFYSNHHTKGGGIERNAP